MDRRKLERVAYHEAGHAMLCHIFGVGYSHVTVKRHLTFLGHVRFFKSYYPYPDLDRYIRFQLNAKLRNNIEARIMILLGGFAAVALSQKNIGGTKLFLSSGKEYLEAYSLTFYMDHRRMARVRYLGWLFERTKETLELPWVWQGVEAIVKELMVNQKLERSKAEEIINRTRQKPRQQHVRWFKKRLAEDLRDYNKLGCSDLDLPPLSLRGRREGF